MEVRVWLRAPGIEVGPRRVEDPTSCPGRREAPICFVPVLDEPRRLKHKLAGWSGYPRLGGVGPRQWRAGGERERPDRLWIRIVEDTAVFLAQATGAASSLEPKDALTILLTVETLLFAAFGIAVSLAGESVFGQSRFFTSGVFALIVFSLVVCVSFGSVVAWYHVFVQGAPQLRGAWGIEAITLLIGIVAQPVITALIGIFQKR